MTEAEWLACEDPRRMLEFVRGTASGRKLRLFVADTCRRLWHLLTDKPYRHAVDVAEQFADGLATDAELAAACHLAYRVALRGSGPGGGGPLWNAGWWSTVEAGARDSSGNPDAPAVLSVGASWPNAYAGAELCVPWAAVLGADQRAMAATLRDLVHPPFRPVRCRAAWRSWGGGTVAHLAAGIYAELAFDRLPVLADALEDAGCTEAELLGHLRSDGPHVRGCWALDAVLGKS
jgi:hypothetical protein